MNVECEWCGAALSDEERELTDASGDSSPGRICNECFHEHYEFTCDRCQNYEYVDYEHCWLVVFEPTDAMGGGVRLVTPGVYEVVAFPYYGGPLIGGGHLLANALRKVKAGTEIDWDQGNYPCGHICRACARELKLRQSKRGRALLSTKISSKT